MRVILFNIPEIVFLVPEMFLYTGKAGFPETVSDTDKQIVKSLRLIL